MSINSDETERIDLLESVFELRDRAYRARRYAAAIFHDEAASRLLAFAEELDARADALEHLPPNEPGESVGTSPKTVDTTG